MVVVVVVVVAVGVAIVVGTVVVGVVWAICIGVDLLVRRHLLLLRAGADGADADDRAKRIGRFPVLAN